MRGLTAGPAVGWAGAFHCVDHTAFKSSAPAAGASRLSAVGAQRPGQWLSLHICHPGGLFQSSNRGACGSEAPGSLCQQQTGPQLRSRRGPLKAPAQTAGHVDTGTALCRAEAGSGRPGSFPGFCTQGWWSGVRTDSTRLFLLQLSASGELDSLVPSPQEGVVMCPRRCQT